MVFFCVKQKRTGELCCGVIRASGYSDNRFPNILFKGDKGALLSIPRRRGDNSHQQCFVMCLVFSTYLFPVTSWLQSVGSLSFADFRLSVFVQHIVHHFHYLPPVPQGSSRICALFPSSPDLHLQCHVTSLHRLSQVKVLLRIHRIHTIMSSDRMSPTLP